jgi:hypothetical protein
VLLGGKDRRTQPALEQIFGRAKNGPATPSALSERAQCLLEENSLLDFVGHFFLTLKMLDGFHF